MTFRDLYHLDRKCCEVQAALQKKEPYIDEDGSVELEISVIVYEDIRDILKDCKELVNDLCACKVEDVINK